jgi:Transposase
MEASRCSEEQIIHLLQQAERGGQAIGALCREHSITEPTFYGWRQKVGGMAVSEILSVSVNTHAAQPCGLHVRTSWVIVAIGCDVLS